MIELKRYCTFVFKNILESLQKMLEEKPDLR